jgi:hypothetical protein
MSVTFRWAVPKTRRSLTELPKKVVLSSPRIPNFFATLLAVRGEAQPSVILFRRGVDRRPFQQVKLLLANLDAIQGPLETGCVAVFDEARIRLRTLPIQKENQ